MTNIASCNDFIRVEDPITGEYLYHRQHDKKVIWFRYHWEDIDGKVPTPECDWWNYEHIVVTGIDEDASQVVSRWAEAEMKNMRICTMVDRKIFWEIIVRPPQQYIDQHITWLGNAIKSRQDELVFWKSL